MAYELQVIDTDILTEDEKIDISNNLDRIIAQHKNNRKEINRLVFESVAAMTEADEAQSELSDKGIFARLIGGITGSNRKLQDKINNNRAAAQYACQRTLQKLAEQNLMTFDLLTAVNNKLNASVNAMNDEFKNIYYGLSKFLKHNKNELVRIEDRVAKNEQDVVLLNWRDSIKYQEFDGEEYVDMDDAKKIVCLVRDFYEITKGKWSASDLRLLKGAMAEIDIQPKAQINYFNIIWEIAENQTLKDKLLGGYTLKPIEDPSHLISMGALEKMETLEGKDAYIVDTILDYTGQDDTKINRQEVRETLTKKYLRNKANVNADIEVEGYDLILDLLYNVKQAEDEKLLVISEGQQPMELLEAEDVYAKGKYEEALELFRPLADAGIARAMYFMGELYASDLPMNQLDDKVAAEWRSKGAELGDALCCLNMAYNEGVSEDERNTIIKKEFGKVKSLADNGDRFAQGEVGSCYSHGLGVEYDIEKAKRYHLMAAEQGVEYYFLIVGRDFEQCEDFTSAHKWFRKAGVAGNGWGWHFLACNYYAGNGVAEDPQKAIDLFKKSYEMDDASSGASALRIGMFFDLGEDYTSANEWYRKAGEVGDGWGWHYLACNYRDGIGVAKDKKVAIELFKNSYEMDDDSSGDSANELFLMFYKIDDYENEYEWAKKSAEKNYGWGMYNLGYCYKNGFGTKVDYAEARKWYKKALEAGIEEAKQELDNMR